MFLIRVLRRLSIYLLLHLTGLLPQSLIFSLSAAYWSTASGRMRPLHRWGGSVALGGVRPAFPCARRRAVLRSSPLGESLSASLTIGLALSLSSSIFLPPVNVGQRLWFLLVHYHFTPLFHHQRSMRCGFNHDSLFRTTNSSPLQKLGLVSVCGACHNIRLTREQT